MNRNRCSITRANAAAYLKIKAHKRCEDYQNTHPSVLFFSEGWMGWRFWMGLTPYAFEDENLENPCIMVSNNGIDWVEPKKGLNPLAKTISKRFYHYSDPELVATDHVLEIWYRKRVRIFKDQQQEIIMRKVSSDGVHWSRREVLYRKVNQRASNLLSPCVLYEDGIYKIWVSDFDNKIIGYYETETGKAWRKVRDISVLPYDRDKYVWHMSVRRTRRGYEMYYCAGSSYLCNALCYSWSPDNISWSAPVCVMKGRENCFDAFLYRPTFVDADNGKRLIYYGAQKREAHQSVWTIGLTWSSIDEPLILSGDKEST